MNNKIKIKFDFGASLPVRGVCCVYQLLNSSGDVLYVGQTLDLKTRLNQHILSSKSPDSFSFEVVDKSRANNVEAARITQLKPALNKSLPTNDFYTSKAKLKKELTEMLHCFIDELDPDFEIESKMKLAGQYLHSYNALILRDIILTSHSDYLRTVKEDK